MARNPVIRAGVVEHGGTERLLVTQRRNGQIEVNGVYSARVWKGCPVRKKRAYTPTWGKVLVHYVPAEKVEGSVGNRHAAQKHVDTNLAYLLSQAARSRHLVTSVELEKGKSEEWLVRAGKSRAGEVMRLVGRVLGQDSITDKLKTLKMDVWHYKFYPRSKGTREFLLRELQTGGRIGRIEWH